MNQAFYIGAVGAQMQQRRMNIIGDNIANLHTVGFKADRSDFTALMYQNHRGALNGGDTVYTRAGSFSLDDEGYLCFPGQGYVLDPEGERILLRTDKLDVDQRGNIFQKDNGGYLGTVGVYEFEDLEQLEHNDAGFFTGEGAEAMETPEVMWKYLERSNVDMIRQMTDMLTCQRALQSAASVTKMYDEVMGHAASDVGRLG